MNYAQFEVVWFRAILPHLEATHISDSFKDHIECLSVKKRKRLSANRNTKEYFVQDLVKKCLCKFKTCTPFLTLRSGC